MFVRSGISVILLSFILSFGAIAQIAFQTPSLPSIDKRKSISNEYKLVDLSRERDKAKMYERLPEVRLYTDDYGIPTWIAHTDRLLTDKNGINGALGGRIPGEGKDSVIRAFLDEYRALYGHGSEVLQEDDLETDATDKAGVHSFIWQQKLDGLVILDSRIRAHLTKDNELISVSGSMIPYPVTAANNGTPNRTSALANPPISDIQAVVLAAASIGETVLSTDITATEGNAEQPQTRCFITPGLCDDTTAKLIWYPAKRNFLQLAWQVELTGSNRYAYFVIIDACNGEVLARHCRTVSAASQAVAYRVFTGDSPRPFSPGWPTYSTVLPPVVARNYVSLVSLNNSDLKGWIEDGKNETGGNNIYAYYPPGDRWHYSITFLGGSPYRAFSYPLDVNGTASNYKAASVTQAFYVCNLLHDRLYEFGWTEDKKNCQVDNFGRGGFESDPMGVYVQTVSNNAYCTLKPDGQGPYLDFGVMSCGSDNALDSEVVAHEYVHEMSSRMAGGWNAYMTDNQSQGLGEGWSDFYGISLWSQPDTDNLNGNYGGNYAFGAYSCLNYYHGFRRYPYSTDMTKNPLTYKNIWTLPDYPGIPGNDKYLGTDPAECHNAGEVWCVTLWDARVNMIKRRGAEGNTKMMQTVLNGLWLGPDLNPSFLQARDALLTADTVYDVGNYRTQLWEAFAKRGMGYGASYGVESFSKPPIGNTCATPTFDPPGGCYTYNPQVTMTCTTPGATIRYTTDGTQPTTSSPVYSGPVTISASGWLRAKAFKTGVITSADRIEYFKRIDCAATPVLDPPGGTYQFPVLVNITCETEGATIRYTTDNTNPTITSPLYSGPILADGVLFLKAKAWASDLQSSLVASGVYTIRPPKYVNCNATGTPHDGSSWDKAYLKITDALNATTIGELWVAKGTYNERITLKDSVSVYGGFEGNETLRDQRNPISNITIIDGGAAGITVFAPMGVTSATTIDGFTIRNGKAYSAGGVYCYSSSPIITNNIIENNHSTGHGGGICSYQANPTIIGNIIRNNTAEFSAGVYLSDGQTVLTNNLIYNNTATYTGGGVECFASTPTSMDVKIINNTIYNNTAPDNGGGIYCSTNSKPHIYNNIVAFNTTGIEKVATAAPVLHNNDVYGNGTANYVGLTAGTGDISADPQFGNRLAGDLHIRRNSPCVDRGSSTAPSLPVVDMDRQERVNNSIVDIGADESYGESFSLVYRVKYDSPINGPGSTWDNAYHTVTSAMNAALPGDKIWVAKGRYGGNLTLKRGVALYGGFSGWETDVTSRCWRTNNTELNADGSGGVITVESGADSSTIIDGFTIANGRRTTGGGIYCGEGSTPVIANNILTSNTANGGVGGAIYCGYATPTVENNIFYGNVATTSGAGIYCEGTDPTIRYNTFHANECPGFMGGGLALVFSEAVVEGNIFVGNLGYGIWCDTAEPVLTYNDFYKNKTGDCYGISSPIGTNGNIGQDPMLVDASGHNYHLKPTSPCIDKGSINPPQMDKDGYIRPQDGNTNGSAIADIGAYEYPVDFSWIRWNSPDGSNIAFSGLSVTAIIPGLGMMYVEKPDRSCGIGVLNTANVSEGDIVNVIGRIEEDSLSGERLIGPESTVSFAGKGTPLGPLGLSLSRLGGCDTGLQTGVYEGAGLNNIGLLVKVWGRVNNMDSANPPTWLTLDDGSGPVVRVEIPFGVTVDRQAVSLYPYISVTGISSCRSTHGRIVPRLRMRQTSDLTIIGL